MGSEQRKIDSQNRTQIDINNANIQHQKEENQKDREFQQNQWQREFDQQSAFQRAFWREQFEAENAYNSPTAQVARLQAAGINPAALVSQIAGAAPAASPSSSAPSPSAPSGGHGISGSIPSAIPISTDAALFSSLAQLNDSLNNAAKVGLQANEQNVMLQRNAANVSADTMVKQENARHMSLQNSIYATYGDKQAATELIKSLNEIEVLKTEGKLKEASTKYQDILTSIEKQKFGYNEEAFPIMIQNLRQYGDTLKAEAQEHRSAAKEHNASASLKLQQTETEKYQTELRSIEADNNYQAKAQKLETMLSVLRADAAEANDRETVAEINNILDTFVSDEYKKHPDAARLDAALRKTGVLIKTISPVTPSVKY